MFDPLKPWFQAAEDNGEYIGIRFGHLFPGAKEPEWIYKPHTEVDGIGGLAEILRSRGGELARLPETKHPPTPSRLAVLRNVPKFLSPKRKLAWRNLAGPRESSGSQQPPKAAAWHVFPEEATMRIRRICRNRCITVNSFLLSSLTKAIRPSLEDQSATIPWMVPVNLRGKISRANDIENHSSYVSVKVHPYDTVHDVHQKTYAALARGDHWANWFAYDSSRILPSSACRYLVRAEKCMAEWNIGAFSNLGDWDREKKLNQPGCAGAWLFSPPVLRFQQIGAGCVTFQNQLTLLIHVHPELTINPEVPAEWVRNWVNEIDVDLASVLP